MSYMFMDESKVKDYIMAAALTRPDEVGHLRSSMQSLLKKGQSRIHFTKESDRSRRILSRLEELGVQAQIFHCDSSNFANLSLTNIVPRNTNRFSGFLTLSLGAIHEGASGENASGH